MQLRWISLIGCLLLLGLVYPINQTLAAPTTYTVTKTADTNDGVCNADCSLREAITAANLNVGKDTIQFNIPGAGVRTIQPLTALPTITDPVIIDGTTQPGFPGTPIIELDGSLAGNASGLWISSGNTIVRSLLINNFQYTSGSEQYGSGIVLEINGDNVIEGNYIGINATGTSSEGNDHNGIWISSRNNRIGGITPAARNVISGNGIGIEILSSDATYNRVTGNYIGTNAAGTAAIGNQVGIEIKSNAHHNLVGGTTSAERNLISGNLQFGIAIGENSDPSAVLNHISGNYIGTDVTGTQPLGNISSGIVVAASTTIIGDLSGSTPGEGNVIAYNGKGVIISPNTLNPEFDSGNAILSNRIFGNTGLGIDLNNDGVTPNDLNDLDDGPNVLQNFPVLTSAQTTGNSITITGTLNSGISTYFRLQFFVNDTCDASGYGEGQIFLGDGSTFLESGENNTSFTASFQASITAGKWITATATNNNSNSTSEFSACIAVTNAPQNPQTFNVTKTTDTFDGVCNADCSLREAINAANANAGSTVNIPAGTYTITRAGADEDNNATGDLDIRNHMTINGAGGATTIVDGSDLDRVFHLIGGYTVSLSNMTVQNGKVTGTDILGGGIYNQFGALTINNMTITSNDASQTAGGGLYADVNSATTLNNCQITDNLADGEGGGVRNRGILTINTCNISNNITFGLVTAYGGGGIYSGAPGSSLTVVGSTISNNVADGGGAIWSYDDTFSIADSVITNNSTGALYVGGGTITNTTFSGNTSDFGGGAVMSFGYPLRVMGSTFVNNHSDEGGGAIYAWRTELSHMSITNSTFSGNTAPIGGAILVGDNDDDPHLYAPITIVHSTFNGNTATTGGGAIYAYDNSTVTVFANIFGNNTGGNCVLDPSPGGIITSTGYNISADTSCNTYFTAVGDLNNTNPLLAALADNGGLTQTMALLNGSPALDRVPTANCTLATDQRGVTRPFGSGCDSGAYEFATEIPQTGLNLHVNTTSDTDDGVCGSIHCSLREAITAANANPGSTVNIPAGTYTITRAGADEDNNATGDFDINAAMTITGAGASTTIIDGNDLDRVFHVTGNFSVNLSKVTVRNGYVDGLEVYGGGIFNASGTLHIGQSTITDNRTDSVTGGGIATWTNTTTTITESTLSNNYARMGGGGLANYGIMSVSESLITNNTVNNAQAYGGGGVISAQTVGASLTVMDSTITNNAANDGGGIYSSSPTTITDSIFTDNEADNAGSALYIHVVLTLSGSTLSNNTVPTASEYGGAIFIDADGSATIQDSTFDNNTSSYGGAIWNYSQQANALEIFRSTFSNHTTGAVNTNGGTITDSTFLNNMTTFYGAAISSYDSLTINRSLFVNNIGDSVLGIGAVWLQHGDNQILNSTFFGNSGFRGGAIYIGNDLSAPNEPRTNLTITHSTLSGNTASDVGGGIYAAYNADITFRANILNVNVGGNCALSATPGGVMTSTGYNISSDASCNSYFTAVGDLNNTNPLMAALANNGGLTQTIALLAGSPALNRVPSANCTLSVDQRGFVRPVGSGCDSGAYESNSTPAPPPSEAPQRNYFTTSTPTLTWSRVTNAASYIIEVDTDRNFTAPFAFRATGVTTTSITTTSLPDGTYYWRVRMVNANGIPSMWSLIDSFVVGVP